MKRTILFIWIVISAVFQLKAKQFNDTIFYTLSPTSFEKKLALNFDFQYNSRFINDTLYIPDAWASETELYKCLKNFSIQNKRFALDSSTIEYDSLHNAFIVLHSAVGESIKINYTVIQDVNQAMQYDNENKTGYFRPIIQPNYFQLIGYQFLFYQNELSCDSLHKVTVKFKFKNFDSKWKFLSSYGSKKNIFYLSDFDNNMFQNCLFAGTRNTKIYTYKINNCSLNICSLNKSNIADSSITNIAKKVMNYQLNKVWNDTILKSFVIVLHSYAKKDKESTSDFFNGTALNDAFCVAMNEGCNINDLNYLFSHELIHRWIGNIIDFEGDYQLNGWFREGFADYVAVNSLYKNKIDNLEKLVKNTNRIIESYYCSPVNTMPNDSLLDNFWKDEFWGKLPYQRGFILAMKIDYQLSKKSNYQYTLNSFLKDLLTWSLEHKTQKLTNKIFMQLLNPHLEKPIDDYFNQHVIQGNLIEIEEWKFKDVARIIYQITKVNDKLIEVPQYKLKADF